MRLLQKRFDGEADGRLGIIARCYDADLHWYPGITHVTEAKLACQKPPLLLGDRNGCCTFCALFGAEDPYQTAECADDKRYAAEQKRHVHAFGGGKARIAERQPHGGL